MKILFLVGFFFVRISLGIADEPKAPRGDNFSSFSGFSSIVPPVPLITYEGRYSPSTNAPSFTENKLNLSSPIYRTKTDTLALILGGGLFHLGDSVTLDSGKKVSSDLYKAETGAQYFKQLPEKKSWGLKGTMGYAGDKPSAKSRDLTYNFSANYGFPSSQSGHWMLMVFFSNNSILGNFIPLPGVSYLYRTDTFTGMFGFPILSMRWTPIVPWSFSLGLFWTNIRSEVAYSTPDQVQFFSGFYWTRQSYIPWERDNDKDRLTIEEKKVGIGLRKSLGGSLQSELQMGQAYDRLIYVGHGHTKKGAGTALIPSEWYASMNLKMKF